MDKKGSILRKSLVLIILIFFIGTFIVSSSDINPREKSSFDKYQESSYESEKIVNDGKIAYAYNAYPGPEETVYFPLDDPSDIEVCGDTISGDFLIGGTIVTDELWYGTQYGNGLLFGIDPETCEMWPIGGGGGSGGDIAWDDWTRKLYSSSMSGLAFNNEGICYGVNFDGSSCNLYMIEFNPHEQHTLIGPLINFTYDWGLIDAEFDKDTNILYIICPNGLYKCDTETRECTFIGSTGGIELSALAIPYEEYYTIPFTEISFNPPIPDGENGWYVNNVTATLNPIGFVYGFKATYYRINGAEWKTYDTPFLINEEGNDILIEYYTVDNNGTAEDVKSETLDIDKTSPYLDIFWEIIGNPKDGWELVITVRINENCSGMDRVEFYINNELQETVTGPGPTYTWSFSINPLNMIQLSGLICIRDKTEENVSFYSIFVKASEIQGLKLILCVCVYDLAGNCECDETIIKRILPIEPGFYIFKKLTLPNEYLGYVGRFLITAKF